MMVTVDFCSMISFDVLTQGRLALELIVSIARVRVMCAWASNVDSGKPPSGNAPEGAARSGRIGMIVSAAIDRRGVIAFRVDVSKAHGGAVSRAGSRGEKVVFAARSHG